MSGLISSRVRWRLTTLYLAVLLLFLLAIGVSLLLMMIGGHKSFSESALKEHTAIAKRLIEADPKLISDRAHLAEIREILDRDISTKRLSFRRNIVLIILLVTIMAGVVIYMMIGKIAGPITRMNEMTEAIAGGDLDRRLEVSSTDEIGRLARNLNDLAQQLKKAVDQLADQTGKMDTMLASMTDGIIVTDEQNRIVVFNQACERFFRKTSTDVLNKSLKDIDLHLYIAAMVEESTSAESILRREIRLPGREEIILGATASPLRHASGKTIGSVVILHDLTEIRKHEKAQREFVANVSHELRTPITAIRVTAEALMSGAKEDPALMERFTSSLVSESERLSALIDDLLEIAKRDAGRKPMEKGRVSLRAVGERAHEYWEPRAASQELTLECNLPKGVFLKADERQMGQVFDNLLSNAIKYTPRGGKITISAMEKDCAVSITVSDTGIGIPQGDIPRVFERFYRVDKTRSRQLGGTGLGLSIVKDIVESHDGSVTVESELGKGSSFTVTIPRWVEE